MQFDDNSMEYIEHRARMRDFYLRRRSEILRLLFVLLVAFPVLFAATLLVPPVQGILSAKQRILEAQLEGMKRIPELEHKLEKLNSQISILATESIDRCPITDGRESHACWPTST
jgi:hypothetical protein